MLVSINNPDLEGKKSELDLPLVSKIQIDKERRRNKKSFFFFFSRNIRLLQMKIGLLY
jgi:hypothetical protein